MLTAIITIVAALSLLILIGVGIAMTLSVIFNADPYDDIHYTDD
jgi:hypothetical protein